MVKLPLPRTSLGHLPPIFLAPCLLSPPTRSIGTSSRRPKSATQAKGKTDETQDTGAEPEAREMGRERARTSSERGSKKDAIESSFEAGIPTASPVELIDPSPSAPPSSLFVHWDYLDQSPSPSPPPIPKPPILKPASSSSHVTSEVYHSSYTSVAGSSQLGGQSISSNSSPSSSTSNGLSGENSSLPKSSKWKMVGLECPRGVQHTSSKKDSLSSRSSHLHSPSSSVLLALHSAYLPPSPRPQPRRQPRPRRIIKQLPLPSRRIPPSLPSRPSFLTSSPRRARLFAFPSPGSSPFRLPTKRPTPRFAYPTPRPRLVIPPPAPKSRIRLPPSFLSSPSKRVEVAPVGPPPFLLALPTPSLLPRIPKRRQAPRVRISPLPPFLNSPAKPVEVARLDPPPSLLAPRSPSPPSPLLSASPQPSRTKPPPAGRIPSPPSFLNATPSRDGLPQASPPYLLLGSSSQRSLDINPSIPLKPARPIALSPPKISVATVALRDSLIELLISSARSPQSSSSALTLALSTIFDGKPTESDDLVWSLYSALDGERLPPSLLPILFNSQHVLDLSSEERARRLLRIFRDASQDPLLSVPSSDSVGESPRWWLSLEQLEETFESALRVAEAGSDASSSIGVSILLREVWSKIVVMGGEGSQAESRRGGLLWRWVGISLPRSLDGGGIVGTVHHPPSSSSTRIIQLARLLDQVGSPSIKSLRELGRSFLGGRTDPELIEEIEIAIEQTEELRRTRDNALHPSRFSTEDRKTRRIVSSDPGSFQTTKVVGLGHGKDVEAWINELLPSINETSTDTSEIDLQRSASSLLHRTTTSILLLSHFERRVSHDTPPRLVAQIVAAIHRLSFLPSTFHVPNSELRLFTSTILQAYPTLQVVETEDIYRLLTAFVVVEDLPFASRLYRCFRLRAPEFVLSGHLLQKLIELSIGLRTLSVPEVEDTSLSSHDGVLSADVYVDYISQNNPPLELDLLLPFVEQMGRRPTFGGVAFRAITDSLQYHGEDLLTDELMIVIADATSRRVIKSICNSIDPSKDLPTEVTATDVLDLLPFFRGFCRPPRTPPPEVFTIAFNLVDSHPTPSNLALLDVTFEEMLNHGPTPTLETVNALISAHLKRGKERASFKAFAAREPFDFGRIDMGRVVALVDVMTTRLGLRPDRETWSLLVEGFLETRRSQTGIALETFFHAHQDKRGPYQRATTLLVERLMIEERVEDAWKVVEAYERASGKESVDGTRFAAAKYAVEQALRTPPLLTKVVEGPSSEVEVGMEEEAVESVVVKAGG
ncbi:hypothetical protein BDY24DRAFT_201433 [Mrakia frigida]|uniref:uncharacterized protein n=1 Tax=Mrakia frigida TaxID=29902 RepID=UPI003FCC08AC